MRIPLLSAALVSLALVTCPSLSASAAPTPEVSQSSTAPVRASVAPDAARYAAREAQDRSGKDFQGGAEVLVIGGTTVGVVLLVVLIVILL